MIEIKNLKKRFGDAVVLQDINISIENGEIYGLVGRSGAGKSTLLRCINGLIPYDSGSLKVDGVEVSSLNHKEGRAFRKDIGMIFQHFSLMERRSVFDNIALPMKCWGYSRSDIERRVKELLELVGMTEKAQARPRALSGGQKQRVAIARALAIEPRMLLCDEATSALDPNTTISILSLLKEINRRLGITMVVVTHQMNVVKDLCDRISILDHGELEVTGPVEDIFMEHPPALQRLLGQEEVTLPQTGVNIRFLMGAKQSQEPIIARLVRECDVIASVVGGKMEQYKDHMLGSLIINVPQTQAEKTEAFFNANDYRWEYITNESLAARNRLQTEEE